MSLTTSNPTSVSATATAQAWTIIKCEDLTLDGTYVDLKFTSDTADTFYVVPLGVNIGTKAVPLKVRGLRYRHINGGAEILTNVDLGAAGYTDLDTTANTSALAVLLNLYVSYRNNARVAIVRLRVNGDAAVGVEVDRNSVADASARYTSEATQLVDDGQIFEYTVDGSQAGDTESLYCYVRGYWEWE
ncbi:MAG: hypothetical protein WC657_06780 [Candidatus Paceibacterota bacterium]